MKTEANTLLAPGDQVVLRKSCSYSVLGGIVGVIQNDMSAVSEGEWRVPPGELKSLISKKQIAVVATRRGRGSLLPSRPRYGADHARGRKTSVAYEAWLVRHRDIVHSLREDPSDQCLRVSTVLDTWVSLWTYMEDALVEGLSGHRVRERQVTYALVPRPSGRSFTTAYLHMESLHCLLTGQECTFNDDWAFVRAVRGRAKSAALAGPEFDGESQAGLSLRDTERCLGRTGKFVNGHDPLVLAGAQARRPINLDEALRRGYLTLVPWSEANPRGLQSAHRG